MRWAAAALVAVMVVVPVLAACGSRSVQPAAALSRTCTVVSATLADGPDPGADPVGYAEAQIAPLRQIHSSDRALHAAIGALDRAYAAVFASDGKSPAAARAAAAAGRNLSRICPGAAS